MALPVFFIAFLFLFSSCSPIQYSSESPSVSLTSHSVAKRTVSSVSSGTKRRRASSSSPASPSGNDCGKMPLHSNSYVDERILYFTEGAGKGDMMRYLERSTKYVPVIQEILKKNGLPEDLAYMAMVESGFSPRAVSRSGAVGFWQFMKGTARDYDLHIDYLVDDRRDVVLSTQAAARYLRSLCSLFEDWLLVFSAYNAGEKAVNDIVFFTRERNFWALVEKKKLPAETRKFIPTIIAFTRIAKDPLKYGFYNLNYQTPLSYRLVRLRKESSLSGIASRLNIPIEELREYNPRYLTDKAPVHGKTYIRIPTEFI